MKNTQKYPLRIGLALALAVLSIFTLAPEAYAREWVTVSFFIQENANRNIKADVFADTHKVRRKEYERLMKSGQDDYRVTSDGGSYCRIRHTENARFSVRIEKRKMRLNPTGYVPNCSEFQIRVKTQGR